MTDLSGDEGVAQLGVRFLALGKDDEETLELVRITQAVGRGGKDVSIVDVVVNQALQKISRARGDETEVLYNKLTL